MVTMSDRYEKLMSPPQTPAEDICACPELPPTKLMQALGSNPISCMNCNLEVDPHTLPLSDKLIEEIAFWTGIHDAIYRLWLASGEYEDWARGELLNISNPFNQEGQQIQSELNLIRRCYFWYFQDETSDDYEVLKACPSCGVHLTQYIGGIFPQLVCEACSIVVVGER